MHTIPGELIGWYLSMFSRCHKYIWMQNMYQFSISIAFLKIGKHEYLDDVHKAMGRVMKVIKRNDNN